jgi:hypothetical protein
VLGRILFGADVTRAIPQLTRFKIVNEELLRRFVNPHPMPRWLPTSHNKRLTYELAQVRRVVDEIIAERRSQQLEQPAVDMLGLLLAARDAENASDRLSEREVTALPYRRPGDNGGDSCLHSSPVGAGPPMADDRPRGDHRTAARPHAVC